MPSSPSLPKRLLWFIGIWLAGVTIIGLIAYAIRLALSA